MSVTHAVLNLTVDQGMSYTKTFTWKINKNAVNLSGYTAQFIISFGTGPTQGLTITSTGTSPGITLNATGEIMVFLTPAQTISIQAGKHAYALELTSPDGFKTRVLRGTLTNIARVTNAR